jgi:hypothetical protein
MKNKEMVNELNRMDNKKINETPISEESFGPKMRNDLRIIDRLFIEGKINDQIENIEKMIHLIAEIIINKNQIDFLFGIYDQNKDKDFSDYYKNETYERISKKLSKLKNKVKVFEKEKEELGNEIYEEKLNKYLGEKVRQVISKLDQKYLQSYNIKHQ